MSYVPLVFIAIIAVLIGILPVKIAKHWAKYSYDKALHYTDRVSDLSSAILNACLLVILVVLQILFLWHLLQTTL